MSINEPLLNVIFFRTTAGTEPVREWLKSIGDHQRKAIGTDIKTVQFDWPTGMPLVRKMEADLWEVRTTFSEGIARTFFSVDDTSMVLLHGFVKKSPKTPARDLQTARKRLAQYRKEAK